MTITIGNKRYRAQGEYVGRAVRAIPASPLGNPFHLKGSMTRAEAIHQYTCWLAMHLHLGGPVKDEYERLKALARQGDLTLVCWCHPEDCHARIIKERIERELEAER